MRLYFWGTILFLSFLACSQMPVKKEDVPYSESAQRELEILQKRQSHESLEQFIDSLKKFSEQYSGTRQAEEAKFLLAQEFYRQNRFLEAYPVLEAIDRDVFPESSHQKFFYLYALTSDRLNLPLESIGWHIELKHILKTQELIQKNHQVIQDMIKTKLKKEELLSLISKTGDQYPSEYAYFRLGKIFYEEGNYESSREYLDKALELMTTELEKEEVRNLITQITKIYPVQKRVIGCILPLSGKYASFGQKSLRGIQHAFDFFSSGGNGKSFELAIYDSQGSSMEAVKGVQTLLEDYGVIAIIGPLLSQSSYEAAQRAQQLRVPMINLSQHSTITELGEYIYRLSMTRRNQVDAIIDFSCNQKGFKKYALLYPEDNYGIEFANLFWDRVEECGGTLEGIEVYASGQSDFNQEVKKLTGLHQPKARKDEYELMETQLKVQLGKEEIPESLVKLKPQIDFEALFIPDYAKTVSQVAPMMAYYDIKGVSLLGTQGWNSQELIDRGKEHVEGTLFVDGFFDKSSDPQVQEFVQGFVQTFGEMPQIWEAQANDAADLLLSLLEREEVETREDLKKELLALSEIIGVTGQSTFSDTHDVKKKLFLLTVQNGTIVSVQ